APTALKDFQKPALHLRQKQRPLPRPIRSLNRHPTNRRKPIRIPPTLKKNSSPSSASSLFSPCLRVSVALRFCRRNPPEIPIPPPHAPPKLPPDRRRQIIRPWHRHPRREQLPPPPNILPRRIPRHAMPKTHDLSHPQ